MTIGKMKILVRKLYPSLFVGKEDCPIRLSLKIDDKHQSKLDDDYQEIQYYVNEQCEQERQRTEILFDVD